MVGINCTIELNPYNAIAYFGIGNTYSNQENYNLSINFYKKAVELKPEYADAYFGMGNVYSKQGKYSRAIKSYKHNIAINSTNAASYYNMGLLYIKLGNKKIAIDLIEKAALLGDITSQRWLKDNGYLW